MCIIWMHLLISAGRHPLYYTQIDESTHGSTQEIAQAPPFSPRWEGPRDEATQEGTVMPYYSGHAYIPFGKAIGRKLVSGQIIHPN
jgi:hypothetical protein